MTEERPRSDQGEVFMLQTKKNFEIITAQGYDAQMRMLEKNSYITDQIQEERQVSFMCHIRESESKTFHFH